MLVRAGLTRSEASPTVGLSKYGHGSRQIMVGFCGPFFVVLVLFVCPTGFSHRQVTVVEYVALCPLTFVLVTAGRFRLTPANHLVGNGTEIWPHPLSLIRDSSPQPLDHGPTALTTELPSHPVTVVLGYWLDLFYTFIPIRYLHTFSLVNHRGCFSGGNGNNPLLCTLNPPLFMLWRGFFTIYGCFFHHVIYICDLLSLLGAMP